MESTATAQLYIPSSTSDNLPSMVRNELAKMSAQKQDEFLEDFNRKKKSTGLAYVCWLVLGLHYGYSGKWGLQIAFWVTLGGLWIWWIVDLFRIPGIVANYNKDTATDVMRNLQAISR